MNENISRHAPILPWYDQEMKEHGSPKKELRIEPKDATDLQKIIDTEIKEGVERFILRGRYECSSDTFCMLHLKGNIELIGEGDTIIDGIRNSVFEGNKANQFGGGSYGAITAFPDTYLIVSGCDFYHQEGTAIDYRPNVFGKSWVAIGDDCVWSPEKADAIIKNPDSNRGVKAHISREYLRILASHPFLLKLEAIPQGNQETIQTHKSLFQSISENMISLSLPKRGLG